MTVKAEDIEDGIATPACLLEIGANPMRLHAGSARCSSRTVARGESMRIVQPANHQFGAKHHIRANGVSQRHVPL